MRFLDELRDPKPRLKPGVTYFRLCVFLVVAVAFSVIALNVATGSYPPRDECIEKGIDSTGLEEGTCSDGEATVVVADRHTTLKLETLEAKLLAVGYQRIGDDPRASRGRGERLVTFDLSIRNLTDDPATVGEGQFMLNAGRPRFEDVESEEGQTRSFLSQDREVPAGAAVEGTVSCRVPAYAARGARKGGNLDIVNLGSSVPASEPEAVFSEPEYGVIRTYH